MKLVSFVAVLLLASGVWGQQKDTPPLEVVRDHAKQEKKAPPVYLNEGSADKNDVLHCLTASGNPCIMPPPFDVPPKETDTRELTGFDSCGLSDSSPLVFRCKQDYSTVHRRTCQDKRRVLLMSEDGVWHCYNFSDWRNKIGSQ